MPRDFEENTLETDYHAFVDGDVGRCGAILRHAQPRTLRTRTVFRMGADAPVYLVDHVVDDDGDVSRWRRLTYDSPSSESRHSGTRAAVGTVHMDGTVAPELADAVGGYGEHLVLAQMLSRDEDTVPYVQFDESEPGEDAHKAELHRVRARGDGAAGRFDRSRRARPAHPGWSLDQRALVR